MKISSSFILAIASVLVLIAIASYLLFPFPKLKGFAGLLGSAPPLGSYGIDIQQTSVSGVSSGAAMAVQMHVAHSSIMRGVGVIAGVAYDCADSSLPSAMQRMLRGYDLCLEPISKSSEEENKAGELNESKEVLGVVFPADENAALPLDPGKEALD